jgi:hypothetical protein
MQENTMNTRISSIAAPGAIQHALPEDVAQARYFINSILSLNDEPGIQPGELQGMSHVLFHAVDTYSEMRADCPEC